MLCLISDQHRDVANLVTGISVAVRFDDLVESVSAPDHGAQLIRKSLAKPRGVVSLRELSENALLAESSPADVTALEKSGRPGSSQTTQRRASLSPFVAFSHGCMP